MLCFESSLFLLKGSCVGNLLKVVVLGGDGALTDRAYGRSLDHSGHTLRRDCGTLVSNFLFGDVSSSTAMIQLERERAGKREYTTSHLN